jgi:uracil-DNA glycosylase family 4
MFIAASSNVPAQWYSSGCQRCSRLATHLRIVRDAHPEYYAKPVPPFGDRSASFLIVGLAPGMHGANATGRPFTGDYAGILLYETLHRFGFSNKPDSRDRHDGLELFGCRITNAVKCLPPENKPTGGEIRSCNPYLQAELASIPPGGLVLALGMIAHKAVLQASNLRQNACRFGHGAEHPLPGGRLLLDSYHCSRYNTQTGRLTEEMFRSVMRQVRALLAYGEISVETRCRRDID